MTDRYYPKGMVPTNKELGVMVTTMDLANQMVTNPRSRFPPGYSGHEHMKGKKFGYASCAPDPLPSPPIDPEDPLVNFQVGKPVRCQPLWTDTIKLESKPKVRAEDRHDMMDTLKSLDMNKPHTYSYAEDEDSFKFQCQTSAYLKEPMCVKVDRHIPYTAAILGQGTGFSAQGTLNSVFPSGDIVKETTAQRSWPAPKGVRMGLDCLRYTKAAGGTVV